MRSTRCASGTGRGRWPRCSCSWSPICLGLFVAADLILFFVFFDLSIVGMYFVIAGWGHGERARSALKFFLYTFLGSLALLLGFIGLYVAADPHTFDMVELARAMPLAGDGLAGGLVLAAVLLGPGGQDPDVPVPHLAAAGAHRRARRSGPPSSPVCC